MASPHALSWLDALVPQPSLFVSSKSRIPRTNTSPLMGVLNKGDRHALSEDFLRKCPSLVFFFSRGLFYRPPHPFSFPFGLSSSSFRQLNYPPWLALASFLPLITYIYNLRSSIERKRRRKKSKRRKRENKSGERESENEKSHLITLQKD